MPEGTGFPKDEIDALSLLYLQNKNLSGLAPEEIYQIYQDCHARMAQQKDRKPEDDDQSGYY